MKTFVYTITFISIFAKGLANEKNASTFAENIKNILDFPDLMDTVTCPDPKSTDYELLLYTRNSTKSILLNKSNLDVLDPNKKTIFITHGWLYASHQMEMVALKDAYLKRYDYNVIMVNWENLAWDFYSSAVCKLPKIGHSIADYICSAVSNRGLNIENVHLVGHSLGGQMSGFIGQSTIEICKKKVGRITGLDPAGPLFVDTPRPNRLDSTDATVVDIIHTNGGVYGYYGNCGHADFYINCGSVQEKCRLGDITMNNLSQLPQELALCAHARALHIWAEAVLTDNFKATACSYCPLVCPSPFNFLRGTVIMGQEGTKDVSGGYYVKTNYKSPYAI
ncbi:hypothetical protein FQR65_LT10092 [Abscondita terminalis]|nr:hypothetical protein FQR65_LT10092 [Abscondita terminalis]